MLLTLPSWLSNQATLEDLQQLIPEDLLKYCLKHDLLRGVFRRKRSYKALMRLDETMEPSAKRYKRGLR